MEGMGGGCVRGRGGMALVGELGKEAGAFGPSIQFSPIVCSLEFSIKLLGGGCLCNEWEIRVELASPQGQLTSYFVQRRLTMQKFTTPSPHAFSVPLRRLISLPLGTHWTLLASPHGGRCQLDQISL